MSGVLHIYGADDFGPNGNFKTLEAPKEVLDLLERAGVRHINTAQLYGDSEKILGSLDAGSRFVIDTKAAGGIILGALRRNELVRRARISLERLKVKQVDVFYIHMPDNTVPIAETLAGIQDLYEEGVFRRFGLSNYLAQDVKQIYDHCLTNHYVLPTIYQGNYNPMARRAEMEVLPVLRELGIAFYAYGSQAGGLLAKTKQEVLDGKGRFDSSTSAGQRLRRLYCRASLLDSLQEWADIAHSANCSGSDLACRWVKYNSALRLELGDAIIFSSSTYAQTEQILRGLQSGPLADHVLDRINGIWENVKEEAPLDNINE